MALTTNSNGHILLGAKVTNQINEDDGTQIIIITDPAENAEGSDTSNATITEKDVLKNKIAYGASGQIVGEAPFKYGGEADNYELVSDININAANGIYRNLIIKEKKVQFSDEIFITVTENSDGSVNLDIVGPATV